MDTTQKCSLRRPSTKYNYLHLKFSFLWIHCINLTFISIKLQYFAFKFLDFISNFQISCLSKTSAVLGARKLFHYYVIVYCGLVFKFLSFCILHKIKLMKAEQKKILLLKVFVLNYSEILIRKNIIKIYASKCEIK